MEMKKICFVCNGNNSRSIMAEYIARNIWKDKVEVCSCGINADDTQEVGQNTQTVLKEIGIEIAERKRRKISKELIGGEYYYFALDKILLQPPMHQRDYWDSVSDTKQFTTPFQAEVFEHYVNTDGSILDVGCGYGRILNELYHMGYKNLTGIDFSTGMIARGKSQFPHLNLLVKEGTSIDFPDSHFDAVILFAVLTCIPSDSEQKKLISEIERVLKPGGILYINDFLLNTDERNISRYEKYASQHETYGVFELAEGATLRHHSEAHIQELTASFETKQFNHLTFKTMNGNVSNGFFYIGRKQPK